MIFNTKTHPVLSLVELAKLEYPLIMRSINDEGNDFYDIITDAFRYGKLIFVTKKMQEKHFKEDGLIHMNDKSCYVFIEKKDAYICVDLHNYFCVHCEVEFDEGGIPICHVIDYMIIDHEYEWVVGNNWDKFKSRIDAYQDNEVSVAISDSDNLGIKNTRSILSSNKFNVYVVDKNHNTTILSESPFDVKGHFALRRYGPGRTEKRKVWIDSFQKNGYHKRAKVLRE